MVSFTSKQFFIWIYFSIRFYFTFTKVKRQHNTNMPRTKLPYFSTTPMDANVAEVPAHLQRRRASSKLSKAGSGITLSHGAALDPSEQYQSSLQRDFHKKLTDGLLGDRAASKPLGTSIRIKWAGGDQTSKGWSSTMASFNNDMVNRNAAMSKPNQPDVGVHWNFGEEKAMYRTQMSEDMNIDFDLGYKINQMDKRDRGPIKSCVTLGNEHAEPPGGDPKRYAASAATNFRNFSYEEAEAARGKSAAEVAGGRNVGTKTAVQFGGGKDDLPNNLRYRTTSIMSNVAPDEEEVRRTTLPPAKPIRSRMKIADGPATVYSTNYTDDFQPSNDDARGPTYDPNAGKSAIQIGSIVNVLDYATAASSDYIDFGVDPNPPVQPDNRSKVVLGSDYANVKWVSVNNDRVDPSLIPGAYINARDEKGYKGQKTLRKEMMAGIDPQAEFQKRMQILGADASYKMPYKSSYLAEVGTRDKVDCRTSKREPSSCAVSTLSLKETEDEILSSSYMRGSGVNVTETEVRNAHRQPNKAGNNSRIDISMSGIQNNYETAATADYVVPPPFKQLPRCQPAIGGGAAKASQEGAQIQWKSMLQESFKPFQYGNPYKGGER